MAWAIAQNDVKNLLHYRQLAPYPLETDPTDDNYYRYLWLWAQMMFIAAILTACLVWQLMLLIR